MDLGQNEWKFFSMYHCMFLPVVTKLKGISDFIILGGTRQKFVDESTNFIVAKCWTDVADHFKPYPVLMNPYITEDVQIVEYCWLSDSLDAGGIIDDKMYRMKPEPGYLAHDVYLVDRPQTSATSRGHFKSLVKQYRGDVAGAMRKMVEENKHKRGRRSIR